MLTRNPDTAKTCTNCGKLIDESWFKHSEKFCPECIDMIATIGRMAEIGKTMEETK